MEKTTKRIVPLLIVLMVFVAFFGAMNLGAVTFAADDVIRITEEDTAITGTVVEDFKPVGENIPTDGDTFYFPSGTDVILEFGNRAGIDLKTITGGTYDQAISQQLIFEFWFYADAYPTFGYNFEMGGNQSRHIIDPNNPGDQTAVHANYVPYTWQKFSVAMRGYGGAFGEASTYDGIFTRMYFNAGNSKGSEIYIYDPIFRMAEDGEKSGETFTANGQFVLLGETVMQPATSIVITGKGIESGDNGYTMSKYYTAAPFQIEASTDSLASNKAVTWESGDPSIAEVTPEGAVTMQGKAGTVTLTATSVSTPSVKTTLTLTAYDQIKVDVESVTIGKTDVAAEKGGNIQLSATVSPTDADDDSITWSITEGSNIANITNDGYVTFTGTGTVVVRATSYNGKYDEITFEVTEPAPKYLNLEAKNAKGGWASGTNSTIIPNLEQEDAPEYSFQVSEGFLNGGSWNWFAKGVDSAAFINSGSGVVEFYVYFGGAKNGSNIQFALFCGSDATLAANENDAAKFFNGPDMNWEQGWYKVQIPLSGSVIANNNIALGAVFHASQAANYDILIYGARVLNDDSVTEFTMTKTELVSVETDLRTVEIDGDGEFTVMEGSVTVEEITSKAAASDLTGGGVKFVYEAGTGTARVSYLFNEPIDLTNYKDNAIYVEFWMYKYKAFTKQQGSNPETDPIAVNNIGIYFTKGNGAYYAHELSHKYEAPTEVTEFEKIEPGEWAHMIMTINRGPYGGGEGDANILTGIDFRFDAVDESDVFAIQGMRLFIKPYKVTYEHVGTLNYKLVETEDVVTTVAISDDIPSESKVNDEVVLKADLSNDLLTVNNVDWSVDKEELARIRSGKITYLAAGTVTLTAKIGDSIATKQITITTVPATSISVTAPEDHTTAVGKSFTLTATVLPDNTTDKTVTWSSSDTSKATIDEEGLVSLLAAGEVTFTATANDGSGVTGSYTMTVTEYKAATAITLDKTTASGNVGDTLTLVATVTPADSDDTVVWSSSDESIASVNENGMVTYKKAGTVTITAQAGDKTATCKITIVIEGETPPTDNNEEGGLSTGAIIGIVVAAVVVVGGGLAAFFLTRKKKA